MFGSIQDYLNSIILNIHSLAYWVCLFICLFSLLYTMGGSKKHKVYISMSIVTYIVITLVF